MNERMQLDPAAAKGLANKTVGKNIRDMFDLANNEAQAALAIIDAARVLCALERSPSHHDTHPSHDITTGAGFAHGITLRNETLPVMLGHAFGLVQGVINEADAMREAALDALG